MSKAIGFFEKLTPRHLADGREENEKPNIHKDPRPMGKTETDMTNEPNRATWEPLYDGARYARERHQQKYRTDARPIPYDPALRRKTRTDCKHLEPVPFKLHCFCKRTLFEKVIHECDCAKCKCYEPKAAG